MTGFPAPFCERSVPMAALTEGGTQWFTDLTATDTTFILPLLVGAGSFLNGELNVWLNKDKVDRFQQTFINTNRCLSLAAVPIAAHAPAAICLFWVTSAWFSVAQNLAFRAPVVRQRLGLPMLKLPSK
ncbi:Cytochrome c oxidase assembly protein cox18, mitochondrial [Apophysomyces ossiformis]|uniref:Cytochrome c oxidase assembly protein cox18, mitochondrial n=1 Tax=Apophysomyces ossiformis TaxID=679940 RepID=A0A8H7BY34_9FUNG|nr:Cytochrome c oxidase assembly protein cox18, mitochondrial [Apophysomyces ossiformis]